MIGLKKSNNTSIVVTKLVEIRVTAFFLESNDDNNTAISGTETHTFTLLK